MTDTKKIFMTMTLAASSLFGQDMAGRYLLSGVREVGSELMLKTDGTFEYALAYGAADYTARGTWQKDKDAIVLTTAGKDEAPFRLTKSSANKGPGSRVWVKGQDGRPVPNIDVALEAPGGRLVARTDSDGVAFFPDGKASQNVVFAIRVYQFQSDPVAVNATHNDFHFEINGEVITRVPFKGERLRIDGTTLELRFWDAGKPIRYSRQ